MRVKDARHLVRPSGEMDGLLVTWACGHHLWLYDAPLAIGRVAGLALASGVPFFCTFCSRKEP